MSSPVKSVSVFGLGAMGFVLADVFLKNGYKTTVWNRTPEKAKDLVAKGAHLANTVAEGFEASKLIVICVLDNEAVKVTLRQALPSLEGRIVINLTNGTPNHARESGAIVIEHGAQYIHGGIMATPAMVATPAAVLVYSGPTDLYKSVEKDLAILGAGRHLDTDIGTASLYDLALLSGMYGLFTGFTHAVSLIRSHSSKDNKPSNVRNFVESLLIPWLSNMNQYTSFLAKQIDENDYHSFGSSIAMQTPTLDNIVQASKEQGVNPDLIRPIQRLFNAANDAGYGNDELSRLVNFTNEKEN